MSGGRWLVGPRCLLSPKTQTTSGVLVAGGLRQVPLVLVRTCGGLLCGSSAALQFRGSAAARGWCRAKRVPKGRTECFGACVHVCVTCVRLRSFCAVLPCFCQWVPCPKGGCAAATSSSLLTSGMHIIQANLNIFVKLMIISFCAALTKQKPGRMHYRAKPHVRSPAAPPCAPQGPSSRSTRLHSRTGRAPCPAMCTPRSLLKEHQVARPHRRALCPTSVTRPAALTACNSGVSISEGRMQTSPASVTRPAALTACSCGVPPHTRALCLTSRKQNKATPAGMTVMACVL